MAMMPTQFVLDTNIALYHLGNRLVQPLPSGAYFVSVITEMELLSYPQLREEEAQKINAFLYLLTVINLSKEIKSLAIQWRQQHQLKLPDAIVAATAVSLQATLLTNDRQLIKIQDLRTQSLDFA